jgi:hypothetical protein
VRPKQSSDDGPTGLDALLTSLLESARSHGYRPEEVLDRLEHLVRPRTYRQILIVEPESAMREILQAELAGHLDVVVEAVEKPDLPDASKASQTLVVALPTRALKVRRGLPEAVLCLPLRLRSVEMSLEGETKPGPEVVISIVSRSAEIRQWARAMLIAVGLHPDALCEIDTSSPAWQDRIGRAAFVVADVLAARDLPGDCQTKVFRVIADSSLAELKQLCGADNVTL